jgi:hypothetical protein
VTERLKHPASRMKLRVQMPGLTYGHEWKAVAGATALQGGLRPHRALAQHSQSVALSPAREGPTFPIVVKNTGQRRCSMVFQLYFASFFFWPFSMAASPANSTGTSPAPTSC